MSSLHIFLHYCGLVGQIAVDSPPTLGEVMAGAVMELVMTCSHMPSMEKVCGQVVHSQFIQLHSIEYMSHSWTKGGLVHLYDEFYLASYHLVIGP